MVLLASAQHPKIAWNRWVLPALGASEPCGLLSLGFGSPKGKIKDGTEENKSSRSNNVRVCETIPW
jgi:hypothetical protein